MVIDDLYIDRSGCAPSETNTPLVVDPDAILTRSIALEAFQPVARRHFQIVEPSGCRRDIQAGPTNPQHCARSQSVILALDVGIDPLAFQYSRELFHRANTHELAAVAKTYHAKLLARLKSEFLPYGLGDDNLKFRRKCNSFHIDEYVVKRIGDRYNLYLQSTFLYSQPS